MTERSKKHYPTLLGFVCFNLFGMVLLSGLAWLALLAWFLISKQASISATFVKVSELILVRGELFIKYLPFLGLILFVSLIDGLAHRDIRKFQCARESTFLFHRCKNIASFIFSSLFFVYMAMPWSIPPEYILILMASLSGLFIQLATQYFKKYI